MTRLDPKAEAGWGTEAFMRHMYRNPDMDDAVAGFLARMQLTPSG